VTEKKESKYSVYILKCSDNTFYTGITTDIKRRIRQHNGEIKGGATYTKGRSPVKLVYVEKNLTKSEALKKEILIKRLSRKQKQNFIKN
jgi:putative endonuclease